MNKKTIAIICIVAVFVIGIAIYFIGQSVATIDSTILKDQEVENVLFEGADLTVDKGVSTLTVTVKNKTDKNIELSTIIARFTIGNNTIDMIGYVGSSIRTGRDIVMTASIDKDVSAATKLEYIIKK